MAKTILANFDSGFTLQLKLWNFNTGVLAYTLALSEIVAEDGAYTYTGTLNTGKYRCGLFVNGDLVQRGSIYIGPNEDTTYQIGNWEGSIDVGFGAYYLAGTGSYTITITVVDDEDNPIPNAYVSLYRSGEERHGLTDITGQVQFNSIAATWTVSISALGFNFDTETLVVSSNTSVEYQGTPNTVVLPPLENYQVHVQAYVFDEYGQLESGVEINCQMVQPSNLSGVFDKKIATFTSVDGIVVLENLFQDAYYNIWRKRSTPQRYHVPIVEEGVTVVNCDPILGDDSTDPCL